MALFETITDIEANLELIRRRAYGYIQIDNERLTSISFRPYPKLVSIAEAYWAGTWGKKTLQRNHCLLYFNQPIAHRNFLVMQYMVSTLDTSMTSCVVALSVLDRLAEIKKSDALLTELSNRRLSDRLMKRYGWQPHTKSSRRRHWIKRFYGKYPAKYFYQEIAKPKVPANSPIPVVPLAVGLDSNIQTPSTNI